MTWPRRIFCSVVLLLAGAAAAWADGTTVGVVKDRTADYLLVQPPGEPPRRHWVTAEPPATQPATRPDAAARSAFATVRPGDEVRVDWTGDDRRQIASVKVTRRAAMLAALAATQAAATQAAAPPASPTTRPATAEATDAGRAAPLGERVNAAIDDALAVATRLLELPLSVVLTAAAVVGVVSLAAARRLETAGRPTAARRSRRTLFVAGALFVVFLFDRKLAGLQREIDGLRARLGASPQAAAAPAGPRLIDPAAAQQALAAHFKDVTLRTSTHDAATDVANLQIGDPLVRAYVAVVDLTHPGVDVRLGTNLDQKTLTSAFAKENDCTVAINGEAGQSPAMNSGLGPWRGHLISRGQIVLTEDPAIRRPFLGFDARNHATLVPAAAADRAVPAGLTNVIWGRLDSLVDGVVQTADERYRQPRTAMGINADGTRLVLLVVDGRQPQASVGVTRAEVGYLLTAFGATRAMLCDEGGSSCLYLKNAGGIVNVPSDNNGEERPTYTHFGITLRPQP